MAFPRTPDAVTLQPEDDAGAAGTPYAPPRIERLGTLAELTLGGEDNGDDGLGGSGDQGSV